MGYGLFKPLEFEVIKKMNMAGNTERHKRKKAMMFLACEGKCEYCGKDMILRFGHSYDGDDLATFEHLYCKDHEERGQVHNERRLFLVCKKCNGDKSKIEPNKQEDKSPEKTTKKLVPKEAWGNERLMERINSVVADEMEMNRRIAQIMKQISGLEREKMELQIKIGKKNSYRNLLIRNIEENNQQNQSSQP